MSSASEMVVYLIRNRVNKKVYVGKTFGMMRRRWSQHVYCAKAGRKWLISRAIRKYGAKNFAIESLVENVKTRAKLHELEQMFIRKFKADKRGYGYNLTAGGEGSKLKRSALSIAKQSASMKKTYRNNPGLRALRSIQMSERVGPLNPMFGRKGRLAPNYQKPMSANQRAKLSASWTPERRLNQSKKMQGNSCRNGGRL